MNLGHVLHMNCRRLLSQPCHFSRWLPAGAVFRPERPFTSPPSCQASSWFPKTPKKLGCQRLTRQRVVGCLDRIAEASPTPRSDSLCTSDFQGNSPVSSGSQAPRCCIYPSLGRGPSRAGNSNPARTLASQALHWGGLRKPGPCQIHGRSLFFSCAASSIGACDIIMLSPQIPMHRREYG